MINSIRSGRGWRGRRRIAVLISLVGVFGVVYLGSAPTASAVAICDGTIIPKSKSNPGKAAKLSFVCSGALRAYGVVSNKQIVSYSSPPLISGTASPYFNCEGAVPGSGFGCGIKDRAIASNGLGTQVQGPPGPRPNGGTTTSCGRSSTVLAAGPMNNPPAINNITGPFCLQLIQAGAIVSQDVTLASNPCEHKAGSEPLRMFVIGGEEPPVSSFTVRGDSYNVGAFSTEPFRLKLRGYGGCQLTADEAKAEKKKTAKAAAAGDNLYQAFCDGKVQSKDPAKPSIDMKYEFSCNTDIRGYAITSNKPLDFFGFESEVFNPSGAVSGTESALIQCTGPVPGFGIGCGVTNRQNSAACGPTPADDGSPPGVSRTSVSSPRGTGWSPRSASRRTRASGSRASPSRSSG